jgi:stress-induced morphogen
MVTADELRSQMLTAPTLSPTKVEVTDISGGCGASFAITVVSPKFANVRLLERHRMIHAVLGDEMTRIHALQLKCYTPKQYSEHIEVTDNGGREPASS